MSEPHWSFWLDAAPRPLREWAQEFPSAEDAWSSCDRADWLWSALALGAADRRTLVGSMVAAVRRGIEAAYPGRRFANPSLTRAAAWAARVPDVDRDADLDDVPPHFRQTSNLLLVAATADPVAASATAGEVAQQTRARADLSTSEVLGSRSLLPGLTSVPRLELGVIRERLLLAPELTAEVEAMVADLPPE